MGRLTPISPSDSQFSPRSILVLAREHIGDLVGTTPALRSLRHRFPEAHIAVEVGERAACVLENNPNIDEIILRRDHQGAIGKLQFILMLRRGKFDLGVILDDSPTMIRYLWLGGIPERVGLTRGSRLANLLTRSIPVDKKAHETINNFLNVVELLGCDVSDRSTEVIPSKTDEEFVSQLLSSRGVASNTKLVALNPGASLPSNRWLPERFSELNNLLSNRPNTRILLIGGKSDLSMAEQILAGCEVKPLHLTGELSVLQLASLLKRSEVLVTGDTGPMHLAVAVKTRVVALFGPADPLVSGPGPANGNTILRKVSECADCTKELCTQDKACMRAIGAEEVLSASSIRVPTKACGDEWVSNVTQ